MSPGTAIIVAYFLVGLVVTFVALLTNWKSNRGRSVDLDVPESPLFWIPVFFWPVTLIVTWARIAQRSTHVDVHSSNDPRDPTA
jgi:hypothetical protein